MKGRFLCNNADAMVEMMLKGMGLVFSPDVLCHRHLKSGALVRVLEDWTVPALTLHADLSAFAASGGEGARVRGFHGGEVRAGEGAVGGDVKKGGPEGPPFPCRYRVRPRPVPK